VNTIEKYNAASNEWSNYPVKLTKEKSSFPAICLGSKFDNK